MRGFCLILFTIIFCLLNVAESQKLNFTDQILLEAEFHRAEEKITQQLSDLKSLRTQIGAAQTDFNNTRNLVISTLVYSLEQLKLSKKESQFKRLSQILNRDDLRQHLYYPVNVKRTFSSSKRYYVAWGDEDCVTPITLESIKEGAVLIIEGTGRFDFDGITFRIADNYFSPREKIYKSYDLVHFQIQDEDPFYKILTELDSGPTRLTSGFECNLVNQYRSLDIDNKKLIQRYEELGRLLNKRVQDFSEKKEEKTLSESLNDLTSAMPSSAPTSVATERETATSK